MYLHVRHLRPGLESELSHCVLIYFNNHPKRYTWDKKGNPYRFMSNLLPLPPKKEEFSSLIPHIPMYPLHLHASFVIYIHYVQLKIILGNDIATEIDFKLILFMFTWVWDNHIEKYKMGS